MPHKEGRAGWLLDLGIVDYDEALELQLRCERARKQGLIADTLILLEHEPVYTMGRGTDPKNLLLDSAELDKRGIKLREIRRGGDITFHGPGQLIGYPIIDLQRHGKDVHLYLRKLETAIKAMLKAYHIEGYTVEGMTGVWCGGGKVAAIGVGVSRWVTTHGFALNVNTELDYFGGIIACGLNGKQATSMQAQLQREVDMDEVRAKLASEFASEFDLEMKNIDLSALESMLPASDRDD